MVEREHRLLRLSLEKQSLPEPPKDLKTPEIEPKKDVNEEVKVQTSERETQAVLLRLNQLNAKTYAIASKIDLLKQAFRKPDQKEINEYRKCTSEELAYLRSSKKHWENSPKKNMLASREKYLSDIVEKEEKKKTAENAPAMPRQSNDQYASFLTNAAVNVVPDANNPYSDNPEKYRTFLQAAKTKFDGTNAALSRAQSAQKDKLTVTGDLFDMHKASMNSERDFLMRNLYAWKDAPDRDVFKARVTELSRALGPGVWDEAGQQATYRGNVEEYMQKEEEKLGGKKPDVSKENTDLIATASNEIGEYMQKFANKNGLNEQEVVEAADFIARQFDKAVAVTTFKKKGTDGKEVEVTTGAKTQKDADAIGRAMAIRLRSVAHGSLQFIGGFRDESFTIKKEGSGYESYTLKPQQENGVFRYTVQLNDVTYKPANDTEQRLEELYAQTQQKTSIEVPELSADDPKNSVGAQSDDLRNNIAERDAARSANDIAHLRAARTEYEAINRYEQQLKQDGKKLPSRYERRKARLIGEIGNLESKYPNEKPTAAEGSVSVTDRLFMSDGKTRRTPNGPEVRDGKATNPERLQAVLPASDEPITPEHMDKITQAANEDMQNGGESNPEMLRNIRAFLDAHNISLCTDGKEVKAELIDDELRARFEKLYKDFEKASDETGRVISAVLEGRNDTDLNQIEKTLSDSMSALEFSGARYQWNFEAPDVRAKKETALSNAQAKLGVLNAFKTTDALFTIARDVEVDDGREKLFRKAVNAEGTAVKKYTSKSMNFYTESARFNSLYEEWQKLPKKQV